jgi:hypothetical protein
MERLKSKATTVREKLTVLVNPPPVLASMMLKVPVVAVPLAANVTVEEQFGLQLIGLNAAVTPEGRPEGTGKLTEVVDALSELGRTAVSTVEILPV